MHALNFLEDFPAHDAEPLTRPVVLVGGLLTCDDGCDSCESLSVDHRIKWCAALVEETAYLPNRFREFGQEFLVGFGRIHILTGFPSLRPRKRCQRPAKVPEDAAVVQDQAVGLAFVDAVGSGDGLHQGVRLQGLVEVERRQARHVESGQPHRADDGDAERVIRRLEGLLQPHARVVYLRFGGQRRRKVDSLLDDPAVGSDVEPRLLELLHFARLLAHHYRGDGVAHPVDLAPEMDSLLLVRDDFAGALQFGDAFGPVPLNQNMHAHARQLVDADQHRLA